MILQAISPRLAIRTEESTSDLVQDAVLPRSAPMEGGSGEPSSSADCATGK
jgi:hypothetical protein